MRFSGRTIVALVVALVIISVAVNSVFLTSYHANCDDHVVAYEVCVVGSALESVRKIFEALLSTFQSFDALVVMFGVLVIALGIRSVLANSPIQLKDRLNN